MPRLGQAEQALATASGLIHTLHAPKDAKAPGPSAGYAGERVRWVVIIVSSSPGCWATIWPSMTWAIGLLTTVGSHAHPPLAYFDKRPEVRAPDLR